VPRFGQDDRVPPVTDVSPRDAVFAGPQPELSASAPGGAIRLRRPRTGDVDAIVASCQDPEALRWTTVPHPYRPADAETFLAYAAERWTSGQGAVFAVADAADAYVGSMELRINPKDPAVADVGYLIAAPARGRGYATAALRALCAWAFETLGLARIEWRAYVGNDASRRTAERAGFTIEGVCRSGQAHRGERRDAWLGAILPGDAPAEPAAGPPR
jgi:RimJ/RimL family protein N-acetyltransferase